MAGEIYPALELKAPNITDTFTSTLKDLSQMRAQQTETMLRQAQIKQENVQTQDIQAQADQRRRDLNDEQTFRAALSDPTTAAAIGKGDMSSLNGKISPTAQLKYQNSLNEQIKNKAASDLESLKLFNEHAGKATDALFGLQQLPEDQAIAAYPSVRQQLIDQKSPFADKAPATITSMEDLKKLESGLNLTAGITSKALALKEAQAKNDLTAAQSTDAAAKARESGVKADKDQFELDLMKGATNGSQDAAIDQRFAGNPDAAQAAKDAFRSNIPAGVKAATDAVNKVYEDRVGEAAKAKSLVPGKVAEQAALLPGQVREAGARASAEIGPHIAQAVGTQKALAAQSPDAFAGIVDSSARHSAENELDKTAKDYTDKLGASQQLLDTIHAAQAGNKAAPGVIPIEQVRSVLSNGRVNQAELRGVSSQAGSLMDRIEGWVNKNTKGEPIPPDILRDTASLATIQQQAARRGYDAGIQRLKTRGVDVSKIAVPTISDGGGNIRARDPQGKLHEAPAGTALPAGWKLEP